MTADIELSLITFKHLVLIKEGYTNGDFTPLFEHLSKNCVFESQWVMTPNVGYEEVTSYLSGKGETLKKNGAFPECEICELIGSANPVNADIYVDGKKSKGVVGLYYPSGEFCLVMRQVIDGKTNELILRIQHDSNWRISRIDLCMPELYKYRGFNEFADVCPLTFEGEYGNSVCITESYYNELHCFLSMADTDFDEYGEVDIPIDKWRECLCQWERFYSFDSFDEAFEEFCGIDYENFSVKNENVRRILSYCGDLMWKNREYNRDFPKKLLEWINKDYISSFVNISVKEAAE